MGDTYLGRLSESELYDILVRYVMRAGLLEAYEYPIRDPASPNLKKLVQKSFGLRRELRKQFASSYTCRRCQKVYEVDENGLQLASVGQCDSHPGKWRKYEKKYTCCGLNRLSKFCTSNPYHVHDGELELQNFQGYVETQDKPSRDPNQHGIYALNCEMSYTTCGLELTRVTIINYKSELVYERLVKPANPILDYNTQFNGIKRGDLDNVSTTLADVHDDLLAMFSSKTIIVGHGLDNDMNALKLFHKYFIDTAQLFPHSRGLPFKKSLKTIVEEKLGVAIQANGPNSKEFAAAALKLVIRKAKLDMPGKFI